ncbi:hypothetical protein [Oscillospiraceae bacterium]|nr:hypothetical protein [Oscillospiraceae bacterium]
MRWAHRFLFTGFTIQDAAVICKRYSVNYEKNIPAKFKKHEKER